MTTQDLIQQLHEGDDDVLGLLMERFGDRLRRIVRFRLDPRLRGRVDEDDVLQESFLAARQRLEHWRDKFDDVACLVWLRMIVQQTLCDVHRRHLGVQARDAAREVSLNAYVASPAATSMALAANLADSLPSPSRLVAQEELIQQLSQTIDDLQPIDREVLALRHFEELSNQEVAAVLQIQEKAASIRYVRAVKRLRQRMTELSGSPADRSS